MKHGQVVFKYSWYKGYNSMVVVPFRYRYDSVPGIRKFHGSYFKNYYKTPRTTNERRAWFVSEGFGRARRNFMNLPNAYDDHPRADRYFDTSWKKNRKVKRQWQKSLWR